MLDAGEKVLDVGTGGGVPGIVLAIVRPDLEVALCDSVAKKAKAAAEIVAELGLKVPVHHAPVQEVLQHEQFHTLVVRAVAPLAKLLGWLAPHWEAFDRLLVIKGPHWAEERSLAREAGLLKRLQLRKVASYPLPGTESESVILSIKPSGFSAPAADFAPCSRCLVGLRKSPYTGCLSLAPGSARGASAFGLMSAPQFP